MTKGEATELIGTRVDVWTAAQGCFCGTLENVLTEKGRPWRGVVRIDGILAPAQHFERGCACRRGFRVGELLDAGGVNIKPTTAVGATDYAALLEQSVAANRERLERIADSPHAWATKGFADACEAAIVCEKRRLETGEWDFKLLMAEYNRIRG